MILSWFTRVWAQETRMVVVDGRRGLGGTVKEKKVRRSFSDERERGGERLAEEGGGARAAGAAWAASAAAARG